jgi:hypothetical protein
MALCCYETQQVLHPDSCAKTTIRDQESMQTRV